ncbi:YfgM family protein [Thiobaca trueperi]|uniref:Ancillary SecYEG translocon subunit n=1 Tax=Thiobaca trueperi TaxID=127458 RepID=A0A4R3N4K5_9GAMM|nr:tetratricopeptide repeat protein [Thiobaca trueperi]TCT23925.1 putative negative regulator of RcsB-dependent stress response [Thiobaca trueperi]
MSYETDEEKVEAIKKWWKENGVSVMAGVLIGFGAIYGWRFWGEYRENVAAQASSTFEQVLNNATANQTDAVVQQADVLKDEFGSTPYATLGSLVAAKALYQSGKTAEAIAALQETIKQAPDPALASIAALRLARIQVAEGQLDEATATIAAHDKSTAFAGEFAAVRGDIAAARGDHAAARVAYEQAIEKGSGLSQLLRLKLDNLPSAG